MAEKEIIEVFESGIQIIEVIDSGASVGGGIPEAPNDGQEYVRKSLGWSVATSTGHNHTNKAILDATTASFTTAQETKLTTIETGATADQTGSEIKALYEAELDTNAFTDAEKTKLSGIASGAQVNPTAAQIKTQYESNADTNAFTDSEKTKLSNQSGINTGDESTFSGTTGVLGSGDGLVPDDGNTPSGRFLKDDGTWATIGGGGDMLSTNNLSDVANVATARANLNVDIAGTDNSIPVTLGGVANDTTDDTLDLIGQTLTVNLATTTTDGAMSSTDKSKLDGIQSGAQVNPNAATIKTLYESNINTNEFSDTEKTKLAGIESGATADQSDSEIKIAYENNANTNAFTDAEKTKLSGIEAGAQVNVALASQVEAEAGTENTKTMTPLRVNQAITASGATKSLSGRRDFLSFTDPATDILSQSHIDNNAGVIFTSTVAITNSETLPTPTDTTIGKYFDVGVSDTSIGNYKVNDTLVQAGEVVRFEWDGNSWLLSDDNTQYKAVLSTSWIEGGQISINANPALFNISAGKGIYVDNFSDPMKPIRKIVSFGPFTGVAVDNISTQPFTRILVDKDGNLVQRFNPTRADLRDNFALGEVQHGDNATIDAVSQFTNVPSLGLASSMYDLASAIGDINISGNVFKPNGSNLQIDKTSGEVFTLWFNAKTDIKDPSIVAHPAITAANFIYTFRDGAGGFKVIPNNTTIAPNLYDNGAVIGAGTVPLGSVSSNNWSIFRIFLGQANTVIIHYGQAVYSTLAGAEASLGSEPFQLNPALDDVLLRGWLIVKGNATNLSSVSEAKFIPAGKFGAASASVNAGSASSLEFRDYVPQTAPPAGQEGRVYYNDVLKSLMFFNDDTSRAVQIGNNHIIRVNNNSGSTITKGQVVYQNGASAGLPTIALASATSVATSKVLGIVFSDIPNGSNGYVIKSGLMRLIDTSALTAGQEVFLSDTAGQLTNTAPNLKTSLGYVGVSDAVNGTIEVSIIPVTRVINDLKDVSGTPADGQVLTWVAANNQYEPATPATGGGGGAYDILTTVALTGSNNVSVDLTSQIAAGYNHIQIVLEVGTQSGGASDIKFGLLGTGGTPIGASWGQWEQEITTDTGKIGFTSGGSSSGMRTAVSYPSRKCMATINMYVTSGGAVNPFTYAESVGTKHDGSATYKARIQAAQFYNVTGFRILTGGAVLFDAGSSIKVIGVKAI